MNKLPANKRVQIIGMMVEGMSLRAIARMTGASKNTIVKLLRDAGRACSGYQDKALRDLPRKRLQVDEIWSFVYAKAENVPDHKRGEAGDIWIWTAIEADTKLIPSWVVGGRMITIQASFAAERHQEMGCGARGPTKSRAQRLGYAARGRAPRPAFSWGRRPQTPDSGAA